MGFGNDSLIGFALDSTYGILGSLLGLLLGLVGVGNKFLQYFFQCQCPAASEEARYPENIDVLFPACDEPGLISISPSGRYWQMILQDKRYIYDDATMQIHFSSLDGRAHFLNDDYIVRVNSNGNLDFLSYSAFLYNVNGERLLQFNLLQINNDLSLDMTAVNALRSADKVYVHDAYAVILARNPLQNLSANYILGDPDNRSLSADEIGALLQKYGIDYEKPDPWRMSHNGSMQYDNSRGISLVANSKILTPRYMRSNDTDDAFGGIVWAYGDRGVIGGIGPGRLFGNSPLSLFPGPRLLQPYLLLKVPFDYLTPQQQQVEKAKQAQEDANKQQAVTIFWIVNLAIVVVLLVSVSVFGLWRQRQWNKKKR